MEEPPDYFEVFELFCPALTMFVNNETRSLIPITFIKKISFSVIQYPVDIPIDLRIIDTAKAPFINKRKFFVLAGLIPLKMFDSIAGLGYSLKL